VLKAEFTVRSRWLNYEIEDLCFEFSNQEYRQYIL